MYTMVSFESDGKTSPCAPPWLRGPEYTCPELNQLANTMKSFSKLRM